MSEEGRFRRISLREARSYANRLVGLPLSDMRRPALQMFEFGAQLPFVNGKGELRFKANSAVHVCCSWRIHRSGRLVMGDGDFEPENRPETMSRRSVKRFFTEMRAGHLVVERVKLTSKFDMSVFMTGRWLLEIFCCSRTGPDAWRILSDDPHDSLIADQARWEIWSSD